MPEQETQDESQGTTRRHLLGVGAVGVAAAGIGAAVGSEVLADDEAVAATPGVLDLYVNEGLVPMVDGSLVYMRGFGDRPTNIDSPSPSLTAAPRLFRANGKLQTTRAYPPGHPLPPESGPTPVSNKPDAAGFYRIRRRYWTSLFPRRTILAEVGSTIRIRVHNRLKDVHELEIGGRTLADGRRTRIATTGRIAPGGTRSLVVKAPAPGTHVIADPGNEPVQRLLGLHGVLVVMHPKARWQLGPGLAEFERQYLWLVQDVDPVWAQMARAGEPIDPVRTPPVPRYFMLNDAAGFQSLALSRDTAANRARHETTIPAGAPRPTDVRDFSKPNGTGAVVTVQMIRMVNLGAAIHQMHFHGNHVWTIRRNGANFPRTNGRIDPEGHVVLQHWEDVVELDPLDRKEVVLPARRPPEAIDQVWLARREPWVYPMHCHAEPSQSAAGGLYPGGLVSDWVLTSPNGAEEHHGETFASQVDFATSQPKEGSPTTEFRQRPDVSVERKFFSRKLRFPDGAEHEVWSFESEDSGRRFPAPLLRVTEGQLVHVTLKASKRGHTIHWHGIEPDPRNDGVGHTSFEVSGSYTYQWRPDRGRPGDPADGAAGTYFYHCHVNTPLHVQMGMLGPLVVDPVSHPSYPTPAGTRRAFVDGPLYDVSTETLLMPYAVDPRWHELGHNAGLSGEDVGLNRFEPTHFYVLGGNLSQPTSGEVSAATEIRAASRGAGHPSLVRVLNGSYFPCRITFDTPTGAPARIAELISHDGRAIRDTSKRTGASPPVRAVGNRLLTSTMAFGAAERYDLLLDPPTPGTYKVHIDFLHWVHRGVLARRTLPLIVT